VDQITFVFGYETKQKQITLRNAYGQIVKQVVMTGAGETYTLGVADLAHGMYLWEVSTVTGTRLGIGKVIKQ
jgi:hypothetical protein